MRRAAPFCFAYLPDRESPNEELGPTQKRISGETHMVCPGRDGPPGVNTTTLSATKNPVRAPSLLDTSSNGRPPISGHHASPRLASVARGNIKLDVLSPRDRGRTVATPLEDWVEESARLTKPERVVYCDGPKPRTSA